MIAVISANGEKSKLDSFKTVRKYEIALSAVCSQLIIPICQFPSSDELFEESVPLDFHRTTFLYSDSKVVY